MPSRNSTCTPAQPPSRGFSLGSSRRTKAPGGSELAFVGWNDPEWHLQLRRRLDRCNRLDHRSRRMATPRIRARRSRCEQTPLETPTHRAERRERPCDMNAIAAIHTDNVAANRNPMPVDAHAEQPGTRPLTPHQRQLPHLSSQGLEASTPTTTLEVGRTAAPTHCARGGRFAKPVPRHRRINRCADR
jgi:hypothetical protein